VGQDLLDDLRLFDKKAMPKVTSELQVSIPTTIANRFGIRPGNEVEWIPFGAGRRMAPSAKKTGTEIRHCA
jgi:bifunctional DNA-binding transcriptional regulator/antitoxin component of YhaV-PrlF toxin-antitoxin module